MATLFVTNRLPKSIQNGHLKTVFFHLWGNWVFKRVEYYIGIQFVFGQKRRNFFNVILKYRNRKCISCLFFFFFFFFQIILPKLQSYMWKRTTYVSLISLGKPQKRGVGIKARPLKKTPFFKARKKLNCIVCPRSLFKL